MLRITKTIGDIRMEGTWEKNIYSTVFRQYLDKADVRLGFRLLGLGDYTQSGQSSGFPKLVSPKVKAGKTLFH